MSTRGGEKDSRRDPELAKQGTGTRFWRPRCENMTRERCWKLYSGRFARLARKSRELGPRFDPAESVSPTTLGRRWEGRDTAGWGQLSATERERGRRCAAGPARQRAKAEGRALQATRGLGRGKGVGRGAGEGRRKSRPGGVRGAGPRPGSQGLSLFFSNFYFPKHLPKQILNENKR